MRSPIIIGVLIILTLNLVGCGSAPSSKEEGIQMTADYDFIPCYTTSGKETSASGRTSLLIFVTDKDQAFSNQVKQVAEKIGPFIRPYRFILTHLNTHDTEEALGLAKKSGIPNPLIQIGDPTLYIKQTPTLVYYQGNQFKTISGKDEILKALPDLLTLDKKEAAAS